MEENLLVTLSPSELLEYLEMSLISIFLEALKIGLLTGLNSYFTVYVCTLLQYFPFIHLLMVSQIFIENCSSDAMRINILKILADH